MKRFLSFLMLLVFVACTPSKKGGDMPEASENLDPNVPGYTLDTSPIDAEWYIHYDWFSLKPGNLVEKEIAAQTGVHIKYTTPVGDANQKINTMIASGDLPDLITIGSYQTAVIRNLIDGDLVYPLDELAKKYDPYFFKVAKDQTVKWFTQPDGHIYGYPNQSWTSDDVATARERGSFEISSPYAFMVRKDMYEAIGSPSMRTPEEFVAAMKKAKEIFPQVDGKNLIPLAMHDFSEWGNISTDAILLDFLRIPRTDANGKLVDRLQNPELKRWLAAFNEMYRDGLIPEDVFIDKRPQIEEKMAQGRYFAMLFQRTDVLRGQSERFKADPNSIYIAIDGPADSKMDDPQFFGPSLQGWTTTYISKNTKHPDRLIRLLSFLMSPEGQQLLVMGKEGVTYDIVDGQLRLKPEIRQMMINDRTNFDSTYGIDYNHWMLMDPVESTKYADKLEQVSPQKELVYWSLPYVVSKPEFANLSVTPNSAEDKISARLGREWGKILPQMIRAKDAATFDSLYEKAMKDRNDIGVAKLLAAQDKLLEQNKQKLGIN